MTRHRHLRRLLAAGMILLLITGCGRAIASPPPSPATAGASVATASGGRPIGELGNLDGSDLRRSLLGEPPYPSGWEAEVDRLVTEAQRLLDTTRLPDVTGLDSTDAACAVWAPLVGNTRYAVGAFVERQFFVAHMALLRQVAPPELRAVSEDAYAVSATAAAEQMRPGGDPSIVSRSPDAAIRAIDQWATDRCNLPV